MATPRKPFQGVTNILRFNWHFYVLAILGIIISLGTGTFLGGMYLQFAIALCIAIGWVSIVSLFVSYLIYDASPLYKLNFTKELFDQNPQLIINIHAGFDETSVLLKDKFPESNVSVFDFYDPKKHTEVSIKRARKAYPAYDGTIEIKTDHIPFPSASVDQVYLIFAAHEIRNENERNIFFQDVKRVLKPGGQIILTEHLRDFNNFMAYTIGFFHFMPKKNWQINFKNADLTCVKEIKSTPFVTTFILEKNGTTT